MKRIVIATLLVLVPVMANTQAVRIPNSQVPIYTPPAPVAPAIVGGEGNLFVDTSGQTVIQTCRMDTHLLNDCLMG
jgi:hypothetical protein